MRTCFNLSSAMIGSSKLWILIVDFRWYGGGVVDFFRAGSWQPQGVATFM